MNVGLNNPILQVKQLCKTFPGVKALDHVDFALYPGEVHILAGENGAGKSTLVKCILGIEKATEGEILFEEKVISSSSDIVAVHQELTMVPFLTGEENIFFGKEPLGKTQIIIDRKKRAKDAKAIMARLHSEEIPLNIPVKYLPLAWQQMIEIAKAISSQPKVILFDEPTGSLSERETSFLFEQIAELKKQGLAILYISHRMSEFYRIGDRITVLRDGKCIGSSLLSEIKEEEITRWMVGREWKDAGKDVRETSDLLTENSEIENSDLLTGNMQNNHSAIQDTKDDHTNRLEVIHLKDRHNKVKDFSLHIQKGEIVGLAGLVGSGRTEAARLIFGIDSPVSGQVLLRDENGNTIDCTGYSPRKMVKAGLGFLPEDRKHLGAALSASIRWNISAASLSRLFPKGILDKKREEAISMTAIEKLRIATPDSEKMLGELSGGNQQKVIIGKWMTADSDVLIFDEPTRGIDIGAKEEIYTLIQNLASKGKAILLISSELEELIRISDRIYVMNHGYVTKEVERKEFSLDKLGAFLLEDLDTQEALPNAKTCKKENQMKQAYSISPAFFMMLLLVAIFGFCVENYFSFSNFSNLLMQAAPLLVLACGQTFVVLIQGTDLSLGAMMSVTGVVIFYMLNQGIPIGVTFFLALFFGILMGLWNGLILGLFGIPVFIVTLGSQNIFRSIALLVADNQTLYYDHEFFRIIAKEPFCGLPLSVWIALICLLLTSWILSRTPFGMRIRSLGGNPEAITCAGLSVVKSKIFVFVYAGLMAAIGGILLSCRIESGNPLAGNGMEFNSIAAVLIGGISMREGRGHIGGTIWGVLLIQVLKSGLTQTGISSIYQNAIIGAVVLGAILFDAIMKNREEERRVV